MPLTTESRLAPTGHLRRLRRGAAAALATAVLGTVGAVLPVTSAHAAGPAQLVYMTDAFAKTFVAYDLSSGSVAGTVPVGERPGPLAVSPDGSQVWVGNQFGNSISVIDTATLTVTTTLTGGQYPSAIAFSPDGAHVYVAENRAGHAGIDVFDTASRTVSASIPTAYNVSAIAPTPDGSRLYAAVSGDVAVIDTATDTVTASIPTADRRSIGDLAISPDGTKVFATNVNTGTLSVVDTVTGTLAGSVQLNRFAGSLALSPDGARAYVVATDSGGTGSLATVDTATLTVSGVLAVPAMSVLADPDGSRLYVTTSNRDMVVVDSATNAVVSTTPAGARASYTALAPTKAPTVTGLTPDHGSTGGGTTVTVTGTDLTGTTAVTFGGVPASNVTVVDDHTVTAAAPAHAAGSVDLTLTTGGRTVPAGTYTYQVPAPVVTGLTPDHGSTAGGTTVTLTGTDLTGTTAVTFDTTPATAVTVVDDHTVTATAPAHAAGTAGVTLTTAGGTAPAGTYTYQRPAPAVTAVTPAQGPLAGGTTVTLTGTDFTGATAVTFGTTPATAFTVENDGRITATAPAAAAVGTVDITVTTPAGTSTVTAADSYAYAYDFGGFQGPVTNPPAVNQAHAGRAVPMKFSLGGDRGLGILAAGQPSVQQTDCTTGAPIGTPAPAASAGGSSLQYDPATATYTYVWKTDKAWTGTCRTFTLGLNDGTTHTARFRF
ncbi:PxKF domain-containing protein [Kitasatospora purpeofusca]|uniref:YncE family protein n=1 Tax=Kitasatospora purpeofusca TaxID=67352 RepID=A0ABZ1U0C4_9ACTN|nr:PxKF domain-containing protein [Kitasatospora purpeofusca]